MRRAKAKPQEIAPDPIYADVLVAKLINHLMRAGKKKAAQKQVYNALVKIKKKEEKDPVAVFHQALVAIQPNMEVRSRRIGGAAYQVPVPVRGRRKESLSLRWLIEAARLRPNSEYKTYADKLAAEIIEAAKGEGGAMKRKQEIERMAEANRAFAHFKW